VEEQATEMAMISLAIDCMGGDNGPSATVPAAVHFARSHKDVHLVLVGLEEAIVAQLKKCAALNDARLSIQAASEVVTMDDSIEIALRRKKDSSMRVALNLVREEHAGACVCAGNTGALMAVSRYILKTLSGIERPAIAAMLPSQRGYTVVLDLGANVDCGPHHLVQFAEMGHAFVCAIAGREKPAIGLLNVGEEAIKGNEAIKRAGEMLRVSTLNFYGNVEGDDLFKGTTDIVVCDGFVGNVALKASEGLAQLLGNTLKEEFSRSLPSRLMALVAWPVLARFKKRFDHRRYNGAALLGLRGLVIKSHGSADRYAFGWAIQRAYDALKNQLQQRLIRAMEDNSPAMDTLSKAA